MHTGKDNLDHRTKKLAGLFVLAFVAMLFASLLGTSTILPWVSVDSYSAWVNLRLSRVLDAACVAQPFG
jgi:hypothetical protein